MSGRMRKLHIVEVRGSLVTRGTSELTPVARVVRLDWPSGGIAWYRPGWVEVREGHGVRRIPIRDATRWAVAGVIVAQVVLAALALWAERAYVRRRDMRSHTPRL